MDKKDGIGLMSVYNYDTEKYEDILDFPETVEGLTKYTPPGPRRNLFWLYVKTGSSVIDAYIKALE